MILAILFSIKTSLGCYCLFEPSFMSLNEPTVFLRLRSSIHFMFLRGCFHYKLINGRRCSPRSLLPASHLRCVDCVEN